MATTTVSATTTADPYGMAKKGAGNNYRNDRKLNGKCNSRSFDFALDDTSVLGSDRKKVNCECNRNGKVQPRMQSHVLDGLVWVY